MVSELQIEQVINMRSSHSAEYSTFRAELLSLAITEALPWLVPCGILETTQKALESFEDEERDHDMRHRTKVA